MSEKNDARRSGSDSFDNVARIIEQARNYVGRTADLTMQPRHVSDLLDAGREVTQLIRHSDPMAHPAVAVMPAHGGVASGIQEGVTFVSFRGQALTSLPATAIKNKLSCGL
jgi:hypothetical protein